MCSPHVQLVTGSKAEHEVFVLNQPAAVALVQTLAHTDAHLPSHGEMIRTICKTNKQGLKVHALQQNRQDKGKYKKVSKLTAKDAVSNNAFSYINVTIMQTLHYILTLSYSSHFESSP